MKQFLCIQLLVCLGWLSCIALAELEISGAITGSASFPHVGITCLGNLAVFITCILRKRFHLEMGARDFLVINANPFNFTEVGRNRRWHQPAEVTWSPPIASQFISWFLRRLCALEMAPWYLMARRKELIAVTPKNPQAASVIMLSNSAGMTNFSSRQFMDYIQNVHDVRPVLLKYDILKDTEVHCNSGSEGVHNCNCIVISKVDGINMPQVPQQFAESRVLLPSLQCLKNRCHGCNPDLLHVEEKPANLKVEFSYAACDALDFQFTTPTQKDPICLCIPVHPASDDKWTKLLVRFLKYKDPEDNTDLAAAAEVLQSYLDKAEDRGEGGAEDRAEVRPEDRDEGRAEEVIYKTVPVIVIRFVEIFVNLLLTVFFKLDGFSSSLAARRVVRSYVVDEKGKGLSINSFLTSGLVVVKSDSVCQVLKFRDYKSLFLIVGSVNLICSIAWALVLIAFNGGVGKWYAVPSMEPSRPRVAVIIAAICIGICMDCFDLGLEWPQMNFLNNFPSKNFLKEIWEEYKVIGKNLKEIWEEIKVYNKNKLMVVGVIILEIAFAVVAGALGFDKGTGRWVYGSLQLLVWVKWGIGSYLMGAYSPDTRITQRGKNADGRVILQYASSREVKEGSLVYCSSFFLNAAMAGVMGDWAGIWNTWK